MGSNERKVGSGQGAEVLQRLMHPLSILLGKRRGKEHRVFSLLISSLLVPPGMLGLLEPEVGVASSPPLSPDRERFGSLLPVAASSLIFLCFQPVLTHSNI